jgi:hypothetical protein|tara:strand:- start:277 stop:594 length:318 start_codon:yes stop_codon:yes gene_type:complete
MNKKVKEIQEWRDKQEEIKKETEKRLSETDLSEEDKERYLKSISYYQKDMRIKGNPNSYYELENGTKEKRQRKEKYSFKGKDYDFRLDDWEIVSCGGDFLQFFTI